MHLASFVGEKHPLELARGKERVTKEVVLEERPGLEKLTKLEVRGGEGETVSADNALGVAVKDLSAEERKELGLGDSPGVLVTAVTDQSPGAANDIQPGDLILAINGKSIKNTREFSDAVAKIGRGSYVRVNLRRGNASILRVFKL